MKKTAIVHIGLGKTGTTSIQKYLEKIEDGDYKTFFYPKSPTTDLFSEYLCKLIFSQNNQSLNEVKSYLNKKNCENYIISGEILTHSDNILKSKFTDFLSTIFDNIIYLAYVRNPFNWNSASASQLLIDGQSISDLMRWPYLATQYEFLRYYLDLVKRDKTKSLIVKKFEDAIVHPNGIVGDFKITVENQIGIELPKIMNDYIHENKSLSMLQYLMIGHGNRLRKNGISLENNFFNKLKELSCTKEYNFFLNQKFFQFYALPKVMKSTNYDALMLDEILGISYEISNTEKDLFVSQLLEINRRLSQARNVTELFEAAYNYIVG